MMNIDDYVNHIRKKYRLALAVTIIQNKPDNLNTNEYIETLRKNTEKEPNKDFDTISINSKDFLYEDDAFIPNDKEIRNKLEQNKETIVNFQDNNNENYLSDVLVDENYNRNGKLDKTITADLNRAETKQTRQETNNNLEENNDKLKKLVSGNVEPTNTRAIQNLDLNKIKDLIETHESIKSPNVIENFNLNNSSINTQAVKRKTLHNEANNEVETHDNMNSPNILENFDIESAIKAHAIDRMEIGANNDVFKVKYDGLVSRWHKQSLETDKTQSNATTAGSIIFKKKQPSSKPNLIVEDSQLMDDSNTDSNITDCDIANTFMDNITEAIPNNDVNNVEFNSQTTFCDESTQLDTIDLMNINKCNDKDVYRDKDQATEKSKDSLVTYYDLTDCKPVDLKEKLHPKCKTVEEFRIVNKVGTADTKPNNKYEVENKLKRKHNEPTETIGDMNMLSQINIVDINEEDSQTTEIYTIQGFSQPQSHISQSQFINTYNIDPKHVQKAKQPKTSTKEMLEEEFYIQLSPNLDKGKPKKNITKNILKTDNYVQLRPDIEFQDNPQDFDYNNLNIENTPNDYHFINQYEDSLYNINKELKNETLKTKNNLTEKSLLTNNHNYINRTDVTEKSENYDKDKNNYEANKAYDCNILSDKSYIAKIKENTAHTEKYGPEKLYEHTASTNNTAGPDINTTNKIPLNIAEVIEKDAELIPFKVIEEMNRVKVYLSRNDNRKVSVDGFSADSGFLSDSQIKSSLQLSSQCSENWLNQSAHSLLQYLFKCPLLATNMEFTEEISVVLCELIDKLHLEENYPPFLDIILEKIESFLEEITCGYGDESESKTEQIIHRFLLLNKSINIIKYTLEKLIKILEKTHENLTKSDPYFEISNVNETQRISYIFHVLEIIIKRYFKQKDDLNSQNTQPSENLTKKTSITDIWRSKWNSKFKSFKELPSNQSQSIKEDITERLAVILNKIIINCMEGYSLVSFAALQCFNVLQS